VRPQFIRKCRWPLGEMAALTLLVSMSSILLQAEDTVPFPGTTEPNRVDSLWGVTELIHPTAALRGAASCASSGCHGGPRAGVSSVLAPRGSEYPLFLESDPHGRSWRTLNSAASIEILTKLGILSDGSIVQPAAYENCLACHNTDRSLSIDGISPNRAEGVACESCHGPSEAWYDQHYQGPESVWRAKTELGLVDTKPLLQRARACALCHVGAKDRDMNHDIIAAGHPALYFDMAVYHEAYPKHWRDPEAGTESYRAKLWLAGQIAKADAELELLQARAAKTHSVSVWPEFAQYQCTSCHNTLDGQPRTTLEPSIDWEVLGRASVRRWNLQGTDLLIANDDNAKDSELSVLLGELLASLHDSSARPEQISRDAQSLRAAVATTLTSKQPSILTQWNSESQRLIAIQQLQEAIPTLNWEQAALAYVAAWSASQPMASPELQPPMNTVRNGLLFPFRSQSPFFPRSETPIVPPSRPEWTQAVSRVIQSLEKVGP